MSYLDILYNQLTVDEGVRLMPYVDTVGKVTIGVGRNLSDVGISEDEKNLMLSNDVAKADTAARLLVRNFQTLSDNRKAVLCNMAFNLGVNRLRAFVNMLAAVNAEDFGRAADCMLASLWAQQVGDRATRLANLMRTG